MLRLANFSLNWSLSVILVTVAMHASSAADGDPWQTLMWEGAGAQLAGNYRQALRKWQAALKEAQAGGDQSKAAQTLNNLAVIHSELGNYKDAEAEAKEALSLHQTKLQANGEQISHDLGTLALVCIARHQSQEAERLVLQGIEIQDKLGQAGDKYKATLLVQLANIRIDLGHADTAEADLRNAAKLLDNGQSAVEERAALLRGLARLYLSQNRKIEAQATASYAVTHLESAVKSGHPQLIPYLDVAADAFIKSGDYGQARSLLERERRLLQRTREPADAETGKIVSKIADVRKKISENPNNIARGHFESSD